MSTSVGLAVAPEREAGALSLPRLMAHAFLVRAVLAVVLDGTGYSVRLAPDEETYSVTGRLMALYWSGELLVKPWRFATGQPLGYFYLNALSSFLFGDTALPLKLLNCLVGTVAVRYVHLLSRDLFGPLVAARSARLFAFLPSLVLWSALNIRDVWVVFLILYVCWKSHEAARDGSTRAFLAAGVGIFLLTRFRDYLFFVVALPPVVALLFGRRDRLLRNFVLALVGSLGLVLLVQQGQVGRGATRHLSLEALSRARQDMASGGSAFHQDADLSTPGRALAFLPVGIAYFLLSPFPWQITTPLKLLSVPEMLVVYGLLPSMVRGIRYLLRHRLRESTQVLLLASLLTVSYALGEGNVGTLYRHRAQAIAFYLMFAAVGLEAARARRTAPAPASA
jgi:hypothetical protein